MSLENDTSMVMPVMPTGGGYGGFGSMGYGGDWWIIILLLFCFNGFGGFGANGYANGGSMMYPWMNQLDAMNAGFQNQAISNSIGDIRSDINRGFSDNQLAISGLSQQVCQSAGNTMNAMNQGFAGVNAALANGFAQSEIAANGRQMANMQQSFANVQAIDGRMNAIAMNQQQLGNNITSGIEGLKYTVATENCADRYEASQNTRDIIDAINSKTQMINDKLCQIELDTVKNQLAAEQRETASLRNQLAVAANKADNLANTSAILAGQAQRANEIIHNVNPTPVPAWIVQNPSCCQQYGVVSNSCGCNGAMA